MTRSLPLKRQHAPSVDATPQSVLREVARSVADETRTTFTGKGDRQVVCQMLAELEWLMHTAVEQQMALLCEHEAEPDPALLLAGAQSTPSKRETESAGVQLLVR